MTTKPYFILMFALMAGVVQAKTWRDTFDEQTSDAGCEKVHWRLTTERCQYAGIYPGGQDRNVVRACNNEADQLVRDCKQRLQDEAEERADAAREAEAQKNEKAFRDHIYAETRNAQPDVIVGCTLVRGGDSRSRFPSNVEIKVWTAKSICAFNNYRDACTVDDTRFAGLWSNNDWSLSRLTGELTMTRDTGDGWKNAVYGCQKAAPAQRKF